MRRANFQAWRKRVFDQFEYKHFVSIDDMPDLINWYSLYRDGTTVSSALLLAEREYANELYAEDYA